MYFGKGGHINCAECNSQLAIVSDFSAIRVCDTCGNVNFKYSQPVKVAMVKPTEDLSPVKTGTTGQYDGVPFVVTGRCRINASDCYYNLWAVHITPTEEAAWLIESAGSYAFLRTKKVAYNEIAEPALWNGKSDSYYALPELGSCRLLVTDNIKNVVVEGETGDILTQPDNADLYELQSDDEQSIFIIKKTNKTLHYLRGKVTTLEDLKLANTRSIDISGNSTQSLKPIQHTCNCGADIKVYTHSLARRYACGSCGAYYKLDGDRFTLIDKKGKVNYAPAIPLGTTGNIDGNDYTIIAFIAKTETRYNYLWTEYILFNPIKGYAFLSEYQGHWMWLTPVNFYVTTDTYTYEIPYENKIYRLYSKYQGKIETCIGEFNYNINGTSRPKCNDYICPPEILIREHEHKSVTWLHGHYLEPGEVKRIFNCNDLPAREGVGIVQPQSFSIPFYNSAVVAVVAGLIILILQFAFYYDSGNELKTDYSNSLSASEMPVKPIVSTSFDIGPRSKNIELRLFTDVMNNWMECDVSLINEKTDEDIDVEIGAEYYHGYTDGESWSEGSTKASRVIDAVAPGRYHLLITPVTAPYAPTTINYQLQVVADVPVWSNILFAFFLLAIIPFIQYYRERSFEKQRWADSYYSPFEEEDNDDE
ncbi:MAG TPA: DUF4178 domain-containing protein [Chitinophagales bacterium]|nr:DUF4178 domain-containing protein [Chitinophagales bacterium]